MPAYMAGFVEIAFNAVIGLDSQEQITFWNPAAEQLYGWSAREAQGRTFTELFGLASTPDDQRQRLSNLEGGATIMGEHRLRRKDGFYILVEYTARAVLDGDGGFSGYVTVHRDITERTQANEEISRLNTELQTQLDENNSLMEILPIGIWIGNHDCSVITGNPAAYRVMGLTPGINVSLSHPDPEMPPGLRIFVDGVEVAVENAPMQTVARTGKPMYNFEHEFIYPDRTRKAFYASIAPVFDQHGVVRKVIAAYADFTERKQAEENLRLAREYAEQLADRLFRLQKVTAALSEAMTPAQVAEVVVEQGVPALGAVSGTMMLLTEDGQSLEMVQSAAPQAIVRPYQYFSVSLNVPAADAIRSGQPVWIESREQYFKRYPHLKEQIIAWDKQAAVAIPMVVKERTLGVMTLSFDVVLPQTPENLGFALTIARQGAQALERARLYRQTRQTLSELQMTYDQSPIGMIQLDTDLRYIRVNETLASMNGIPAADHIGKSIREIAPDLAPKIEEGFRRVIETGEPVSNIEILGETDAEPGVPHTWLESWYPLRDEDGQVVGLNVVIQDITNRKRDEHALAEFARQQEALYKLADRLHRTSFLKGIFDAALDAILNALQCDRASILLFDEAGSMRFVAWRGLSDSYRDATDGHSPWKIDEKNPEPIFYNDIGAADLSDSLKAVVSAEGIASLAFIPLVFDRKLIGKFTMYFNTPHTFNENEVELTLTVAHQLAFGIQRVRAVDALRESEANLAVELADTKQLQKISSLLVQEDNINLLYEEILNGAMSLMHSDMGTIQAFSPGKDELQLLAWKGLDPVAAAFWEWVRKDSNSSCALALRTSQRVNVPDVENADFMAGTVDLSYCRLSGIRSVQTTPLISRSGRIVGMISTHWREPHQPSERDLRKLDVLARQAADLIERKRAEQALHESQEQLRMLNESLEQKVREQTVEVRKLASDLTKAEQRERHRLAHILHDDLQQRIYAVQMMIEFLRGGLEEEYSSSQEDFEKIQKQLNEIVSITRHLSIDLSPPILRDEGLKQSLEWLASQIQEQHGLRIEIKAQGSFTIPDEDIQMLLFTSVRELLFNVVKHAEVSQAMVTIEQLNDNLRIEVHDEGKGSDIANLIWPAGDQTDDDELQYRTFGLPTLRHRLSLFGGRMDIHSEPDVGTRVVITIPVLKQPPDSNQSTGS